VSFRRRITVLILTRRAGESIQINDNITITVLGIQNNQVRLGFVAPRDVNVHRQEVADRIKREQGGSDDSMA
jgi:carbon storage regulator